MKVDFVDVVDRVDRWRSAVVEWCKDAVMWFLMLRPVSAVARAYKRWLQGEHRKKQKGGGR